MNTPKGSSTVTTNVLATEPIKPPIKGPGPHPLFQILRIIAILLAIIGIGVIYGDVQLTQINNQIKQLSATPRAAVTKQLQITPTASITTRKTGVNSPAVLK